MKACALRWGTVVVTARLRGVKEAGENYEKW